MGDGFRQAAEVVALLGAEVNERFKYPQDTKRFESNELNGVKFEDLVTRREGGLTIREHYAGLALQGLLTADNCDIEVTAEVAVACADALLLALAKDRKP